MKINCGPTWKEKREAKERWHRYFAWLPVRVASHDCRWLETVERKVSYCYNRYDSWWRWEYQAITIPKYLGAK